MRLLLLLVAAVVAVFAGVAALQLSTPPTNPTATAAATSSQNVTTVDVLVAREPIPVGAVITPAMFDKQPWPENLVLEGFIVSSGPNANIVGKVTRSAFQAREPLIISKLSGGEESGFLAASLPAGSRAITIATDAVSGVAGFVFAGDRVDILFTHNIPQDLKSPQGDSATAQATSDKPSFAEVLASNIPVLAINIREAAGTPDSGAAGGGFAGAATGALSSPVPSSMTLQVSDVQAEKIRLAEKVGTLSIALRSIEDRDNNAITQPADLLSLTQLDMDDAGPQAEGVKVIRGGNSGAAPAPMPQYRPGEQR